MDTDQSHLAGLYFRPWRKRIRGSFCYVPLVLLPFIPLGPLIESWEWPATHEAARYIILLHCFKEAILEGILYPRWIPSLYGGYGYPLFCFYQPGFFYFALPFSFLPGYPFVTMLLTLYAIFLVGTIGVFKLCSELAGRGTGMVCAAVFLFTPYLYVNLYVRGDLSELASMLLCPWPLFFMLRLQKRVEACRRSHWTLISLSLALFAVVPTHPATALFFLPILCVICLYVGWHSPSRYAFYVRIALAVSLALALSSPYWWTVFQMREYVYLDRAFQDYYQAARHTVHLSQLFDRTWGFGNSIVDSSDDTMSFQLGAVHFVLAMAGAFLCRELKVFRVSYFLYVALILLMTPFAELLWAKVELLKMIQFPWRLLSVLSVLQLLCAAGLVKLADHSLVNARIPLFIFLLLAITASWHSNQFTKGPLLDAEKELLRWERLERFETIGNFTAADEYVPKVVSTKYVPIPRKLGSPTVVLAGPGDLKPLEDNSDYKIQWEIRTHAPARLRIMQIYFPGWKVFLDGQPVPSEELEGNLNEIGLMTVPLAVPGRYVLEAYYEGPPGWQVRDLLIALVLFAVVGFSLWERKTHR